ncbi:hypothetical protein [Burkholderia sp. BE17]|uniref:InvB/SpaK family type III secretion system chaperone n=1 Tax=Burkholderia sp. BE17 TaxID=2656644 RepID=UPI00128CD0BA|nr:hypothetical protein [Burkholderia sp. BE17]MPV70218.1 hypothetical protein [Burkholderia sp. BE17]
MDFNKIIREMLATYGVSLSQLKGLDEQGTIVVKIQNLPDVMLSNLDGRLWIWSLLPELSATWLQDRGAALVPVITTPIEGVEGGCPTLALGEHGYEWKAIVNLDLLQHDADLQTVFESFAVKLGQLCRALELKGGESVVGFSEC